MNTRNLWSLSSSVTEKRKKSTQKTQKLCSQLSIFFTGGHGKKFQVNVTVFSSDVKVSMLLIL